MSDEIVGPLPIPPEIEAYFKECPGLIACEYKGKSYLRSSESMRQVRIARELDQALSVLESER